MKRIFLALFLLSWTLGAASQNVALGEKTPDLKVKSWLDDRMPVPGRTFLLVFFHSTSRPAVESLAHLQELGRKFGDRVNVVVVVRESGGRRRDRPPVCRGQSDGGFRRQRSQLRRLRRPIPAFRGAGFGQRPCAVDGKSASTDRSDT